MHDDVVNVPQVCDRGHTSRSKVSMSRSENMTIMMEGRCTWCGWPAMTLAGTLSNDTDDITGLRLTDAPQWSIDALDSIRQSLTKIADVADDTQLSDVAALDKIAAYLDRDIRPYNPKVADFASGKIREAPRKNWKKISATLGIILGAMAGIVTIHDFAELGIETLNALYEQASHEPATASPGDAHYPELREPKGGAHHHDPAPPPTTPHPE